METHNTTRDFLKRNRKSTLIFHNENKKNHQCKVFLMCTTLLQKKINVTSVLCIGHKKCSGDYVHKSSLNRQQSIGNRPQRNRPWSGFCTFRRQPILSFKCHHSTFFDLRLSHFLSKWLKKFVTLSTLQGKGRTIDEPSSSLSSLLISSSIRHSLHFSVGSPYKP